jgi:hypothetical protein
VHLVPQAGGAIHALPLVPNEGVREVARQGWRAARPAGHSDLRWRSITVSSVRSLLERIRQEVLAGNLTPTRTGEVATQLSALLGNIAAEIRAADMAYNRKLAELLQQEGKANRARMLAENTGEYLRKREAHDWHMVTLEMIRSLRKQADTERDQMRLAR